MIPSRRRAFTLVELLVVIAVIAALVALLMPALRHVLAMSRSARSLGNLRQLCVAIQTYASDRGGFLPAHGYPAPPTPRIRWADAIWDYLPMRDAYLSPQMTADEAMRMLTPFAHDESLTFGGYGYNYHYLGNGRHNPSWPEPFNKPFHGRLGSQLAAAARTITLADSNGTKAEQIDNAGGQSMESPWSKNGVYTVDPPLASRTLGSMGARRASGGPTGSANYGYQGGGDGVLKGEGGATTSIAGDPICRATPAPRNMGKVSVVFLDGHTESLLPSELDDSDGDGSLDNGFWNGLGRPDVR